MQRHFSQLRMFKVKYLQDFFCCFPFLIFVLFCYSESSCWNCCMNWSISMYQWTALESKALLCSRFFISTASETKWLIAISLINSTNSTLTLNGFCRLWLIEFVPFKVNQIFQRKVMVNSKILWAYQYSEQLFLAMQIHLSWCAWYYMRYLLPK